MAYVQFYGNLPSGFRLKDLFIAPATGIALTQDLEPDIASFSVRTNKGWAPVTYYGSDLSSAQGAVSAIVFGSEHKPWIVFGSVADNITRFTFGNGLSAFHRNGAASAATAMAGADYLRGSSKGDYLEGYAGDDTLNGGGGNDTMLGGAGNDTYYVNSAKDRVVEYYRGGHDTVIASTSYVLTPEMRIEVLRAASGKSKLSLTGNGYANHVIGNDGANTLAGGGGADTLEGGRGNDTYVITGSRTKIVEKVGGGTDTVLTSVNYTLTNGSAIENLKATGSRALSLIGNSGNNTITGNDADNVIKGQSGNDILYGGNGDDRLHGGAGNDALYGGNGVDRLYGEAGNDTLYGGSENGFLYGGAGNDRLYGHTGNDTLNGGAGNDTLASGEGYDIFLFDTAPGRNNIDTLTDFNPWADQMRLKLSVFNGLGKTGALGEDKFWTGEKAHAAAERIIYDKKAGALYYDPDGTGDAPQIKFAMVGQIELSAAAFLIV